jgi:alpha-galactosidase
VLEAWATGNRNYINGRDTSLSYRMLSAMQGALGIGDDLRTWGDADMALGGRFIAAYKAVRATIQRGDLYRLIRPVDGAERAATLYVAPDRSQAVLFAFLHSGSSFGVPPAIRLAGLDPTRFYRMHAIDAAPRPDDPVQSGAYWMANGVDIQMRGDFQATGQVFDAIAGPAGTEVPSR